MCWRGVGEEQAWSHRESHPTRMQLGQVGAPLARVYYIMLQTSAARRGGVVGLG